MVMDKITVTRYTKSEILFKKTPNGHYEYVGEKYTYRLMFNVSAVKPIWIGKILENTIVAAEKELGVDAVLFSFGRYVFDG